MPLVIQKPSRRLANHLESRIKQWPATRSEIISADNKMSDISPYEKKFMIDNLPEGIYRDPKDVLDTLEEKIKKDIAERGIW